MKYIFLFILYISTVSAQNMKWGWNVHGYINENAVDYLPVEMGFFQDQRGYLSQHSVDPDRDPLPGYYHYIDIDYYPEFFDGTLPHDLDSLTAMYSKSVIENNGVIPWIIEEWTDSLSYLMASGQWDEAWQVAAELGHYVADSHQPLHLTLNYNGQLTGNYGIHSRYETQMINRYLDELAAAEGEGVYWPNVIDSVFQYIEELYPGVDSIMIADDVAQLQDPEFSSTYYDILWQKLEKLTAESIHTAILDLASIWRTAWEDAGRPTPAGVTDIFDNQSMQYYLADAYPNPFNSITNIEFRISSTEFVNLIIYNINGQEVKRPIGQTLSPGLHNYRFDASNLASGVYYYQLVAGDFREVKKMILVR